MVSRGKAEQQAARNARLSAALRENLKRRKAQARGRAEHTTGDELVRRKHLPRNPKLRLSPQSKPRLGPVTGARKAPVTVIAVALCASVARGS